MKVKLIVLYKPHWLISILIGCFIISDGNACANLII